MTRRDDTATGGTAAVEARTGGREARRPSNVRTALVLASVALFFFFGVIASHLLNGPGLASGYVGLAALVFLGVAFARLLWRGK
jgi:hypothetical protein